MKLISSFFLLFAVMGSAFAAAPDPELHAELQKSINPTGITKVDWIKMIPMDASGIVIILPSKFEDFSFYTLNGTTAQGDTEYTATNPSIIPEESNPVHFTNTAMSSQPVSFLVECSVPTNAAGEDNWIYVDFETTGTNFTAYGDAKAVFTPRTPELLAMLPTNRAPTTADFPPIPWTDHDSSPEQYTIVLVYCPESSPAAPPPSI